MASESQEARLRELELTVRGMLEAPGIAGSKHIEPIPRSASASASANHTLERFREGGRGDRSLDRRTDRSLDRSAEREREG
eukprot:2950095-Pyramimonas_sp.AAC.1